MLYEDQSYKASVLYVYKILLMEEDEGDEAGEGDHAGFLWGQQKRLRKDGSQFLSRQARNAPSLACPTSAIQSMPY